MKIAPWKIRTRDVIIMSCRKWRSNLQWTCKARRTSDPARLTVSDGKVTASTEINLRVVWRGGTRRDFSYLNTIVSRLMDDYYAQHDAIRHHTSAASQAWDETVSKTAEQRTIA